MGGELRVSGELAHGADEVDGAGDEDEAACGREAAGEGEGFGGGGRGLGGDVEGAGAGEEVFDGGGTGAVDGGEDDVVVGTAGGAVEEGKEDLGHLAEVLVAEAGEEEGAGLGVGEGGDGGAEGPGAGGVVGDVEEEVGGLELEAAGPGGVADAGFDGGVGDGEVVVGAELDGGGEGEGEVALLVLAEEGRIDVQGRAFELEGVGVAGERVGCGGGGSCGGEVAAGKEVGGVDAADVEGDGDLADGLVGFGVLGEGDEDAVGAEDAGFFPGDVGDGGAEVLLVVEGDVGEDGEQGLDDVGGVEAASEAYFEDGEIELQLGEVEEGEGGEGLEVAGRVGELARGDEGAGGVVDLEEEAGEGVVGDLVEVWSGAWGEAVGADALGDMDEVRRGIEAGAEACGGGDVGEGGGGAALAVGAGDEDGAEAPLGAAERGGEDAHVVEVELAAGSSGAGGELDAEGVQVGEGGREGSVGAAGREGLRRCGDGGHGDDFRRAGQVPRRWDGATTFVWRVGGWWDSELGSPHR